MPRRPFTRLISAVSIVSTANPLLRRCSTHPLQQPQLGSLVTVIFGKSAPRRRVGAAMVAARANTLRRVMVMARNITFGAGHQQSPRRRKGPRLDHYT